MKSICNEVRILIVRAKKLGYTNKKISMLYDISIVTVNRIWKLHKVTGNIEPKIHLGRQSSLTEEMINSIVKKIESQPDASLSMIIEDLNLPIGKSQLHRFLTKRGYSFKKKLFMTRHNKEKM